MLDLIQRDPWLEPFKKAIVGRYQHTMDKEYELTKEGEINLNDFSSGYLYFGLHRTKSGWVFREWAPNATSIYLVGDFSQWKKESMYAMNRLPNGIWEVELPVSAMKHEDLYKLNISWEGGEAERIPAWANRVVQDEETKIFSAQVWNPEQSAKRKRKPFVFSEAPLLIYECHIGMAQQEEKVGTYKEFREKVLPRIAAANYNCIQMMAVQEHPYYGSFGYHVSNFFAPSSRFGTPEELKDLIDAAHELGIAVIMDIVHSHAVKNELEGLGNFAGDPSQYFWEGERRTHPAWDSLCFNYEKDEVLHFLLSNCKYWLEEFKFDGFRFDGVTSMLYYSHGLGESFANYEKYYNGHQDASAICYLTLANRLIHAINPHAITIAEEVTGMPGLAVPIDEGGYGFDYRLAMNIPDYWIKLIKEKIDEDWKPSSILWEVTNRRNDEKTISYTESHDQALVGDKTLIFRLVDADMYWHMQKGDENYRVNRGIALHKMIRMVTATSINGGYLNFMGNEFGHPEWIDFPRAGNDWSHKYARRQWDLVDNKTLVYHHLADFDRELMGLVRNTNGFESSELVKLWYNDSDQVFAYKRNDLVFVYNFNPMKSFTDYGFLVAPGAYEVILNTDSTLYGGNGLADDSMKHFTISDPLYKKEEKEWLNLYIPARTAVVLRKVK